MLDGSVLTYLWNCERINLAGSTCTDSEGTELTLTETESLSFPANTFSADYDMTFTLTVAEGDLERTTSLDVYVNEAASLSVSAPGFIRLFPQDPLYLMLSLQDPESYTYAWTCAELELTDLSDTDLEWYVLEIAKGELQEGELYTFEATITGDEESATTVTKVYVERSFSEGTCGVTPSDVGIGEETEFEIDCTGFTDLETSATPQIRYFYQIVDEDSSYYTPLSGFLHSEGIVRVLPSGIADNYVVGIKAELTASNGARMDYYFETISTPADSIDHSKSALDSLFAATDLEDPEDLRNSLILSVSYLDTASEDAEEAEKVEVILTHIDTLETLSSTGFDENISYILEKLSSNDNALTKANAQLILDEMDDLNTRELSAINASGVLDPSDYESKTLNMGLSKESLDALSQTLENVLRVRFDVEEDESIGSAENNSLIMELLITLGRGYASDDVPNDVAPEAAQYQTYVRIVPIKLYGVEFQSSRIEAPNFNFRFGEEGINLDASDDLTLYEMIITEFPSFLYNHLELDYPLLSSIAQVKVFEDESKSELTFNDLVDFKVELTATSPTEFDTCAFESADDFTSSGISASIDDSETLVICVSPNLGDFGLINCGEGSFIASDGECSICDTNCDTCESESTNCLTCPDDTYIHFYDNVCYETCPDGTTDVLETADDLTCIDCDDNCDTCQDELAHCLTCKDEGDTFFYLNVCYSECPDGTIAEGVICYLLFEASLESSDQTLTETSTYTFTFTLTETSAAESVFQFEFPSGITLPAQENYDGNDIMTFAQMDDDTKIVKLTADEELAIETEYTIYFNNFPNPVNLHLYICSYF